LGNGRTRKSLATQLDRLDGILDGLADALNGAVAEAVKDAVGVAVQEAVQAVLTEVLANPQVLERLRGPQGATPAPMPAPARKTLRDRLNRLRGGVAARLQAAGRACLRPINGIRTALACLCGLASGGVTTTWRACQLLRPLRTQLLVALGISLLAAVAVYFAGPLLAVLIGGISGFVTTMTVQLGHCLRRLRATYDLLT
jgi:hypothetical protein